MTDLTRRELGKMAIALGASAMTETSRVRTNHRMSARKRPNGR